jgi:DNA-binding GntR family transcriptional regulator
MATSWEPIQHTHLAERVYGQVRDRILSRAIKTDEQILVHEVAEELGVSRTPVVDAVKRLAAEGLVEIRARRGTFVRGLTEVDVREIFELREALETFAVREAIREGRAEMLAGELRHWLDVMGGMVSGGDFSDYLAFTEADHAFHVAIIRIRNNGRINGTYENLRVHMHVARAHLFQSLEPAGRVHDDHTRIHAAVKKADAAAAEAAIAAHLTAIRDRMIVNVRANNGSI